MYHGIQIIRGIDSQVPEYKLLIKYILNMYYDGDGFQQNSQDFLYLKTYFVLNAHIPTRKFTTIPKFPRRTNQFAEFIPILQSGLLERIKELKTSNEEVQKWIAMYLLVLEGQNINIANLNLKEEPSEAQRLVELIKQLIFTK